MKKKIKLKEISSDVEITLNNLRDCEIVESDGSVYVVFGKEGTTVREEPAEAAEEEGPDAG